MRKIHVLFFLLSMLWHNIPAQNWRAIDSLKLIYKTAKHDTTRVNALDGISSELYFSNPGSTIPFSTKILKIIEDNLPHADGVVRNRFLYSKSVVMAVLGRFYIERGDMSKALKYSELAIKIQEQLPPDLLLANVYTNMAHIYYTQGITAMAFNYYQKSLKLKQELKDTLTIFVDIVNIGTFPFKTRRYG